MTDQNKLELQREILAATNDPEKLAEIAERHGVDPELWRYSQDIFKRIAELEQPARDTLALGYLSAELAARADAWNGNAPDWFPEPLEWLTLWEEALAATATARIPTPEPEPQETT